ncbi:MAG: ATP-grasp fold amidoligase family protein [archaeon]
MFQKIKSFFKKSEDIVTVWHLLRQFYFKYFFTDERIIKKKFKKRLGRELNLDNPIKFNDKIQWLKLNWYDPLGVKCADKFKVRKYVKEKIGEEHINKLYGIYNSVNEINLNNLPKKFVLKGTHGSGFNIICKNKDKINWKIKKKEMKRWMKLNYYWRTREWVYKDIKPRIICEKYLEEPGLSEVKDYKIFCFNGEPKIIQVDFNRFTHHKRNLYDLDWNFLNVKIEYPSDKNKKIKKPEKLNKMLKLSKKLSEGFSHVRVDFYYVKNKIIFGEMTFFHGSGMEKIIPEEFEIKMGNWLDLPKNMI